MSVYKEKVEEIKNYVKKAKQQVADLELLQSLLGLDRNMEFQLDMAKDAVRRGEAMLNNIGEDL